MDEENRFQEVEKIMTFVVSTVVLVTLGVFFWQLRPAFWVFGWVVFLCSLAVVFEFTIRRLTRWSYRDIGQHGTLSHNLLGRSRTFTPQSHASTKPEANEKPKVTIVEVPTVAELLEKNLLGGKDLLLGCDRKKNNELSWGSWDDVRTFAIAGKGRSGKTVTMFFIIIQALLNHAVVFVADPHASKKSSITSLLAPLSNWIRFARTDEEIAEMIDDFIDVMESRRTEESQDQTPYLLVCDEFTRIVEDNEKLYGAVVACAQQYAGYNGYAMIAGHEWTGNGKMLAKLRRALHAVFVHRLDSDYAKYLLNSRKLASLAEKLLTGNNFFQDTDGNIHELRTPLGTVKDAVTVATMMAQLEAPEEPEFLSSPPSPRSLEFNFLSVPRIPQHSQVNTVNRPEKPGEAFTPPGEGERPGEAFTGPGEQVFTNPGERHGEGFAVKEEPPKLSEDEVAILRAWNELQAQEKPVTRTAIMQHLGWTKKRWETIKTVCDTYRIAC